MSTEKKALCAGANKSCRASQILKRSSVSVHLRDIQHIIWTEGSFLSSICQQSQHQVLQHISEGLPHSVWKENIPTMFLRFFKMSFYKTLIHDMKLMSSPKLTRIKRPYIIIKIFFLTIFGFDAKRKKNPCTFIPSFKTLTSLLLVIAAGCERPQVFNSGTHRLTNAARARTRAALNTTERLSLAKQEFYESPCWQRSD